MSKKHFIALAETVILIYASVPMTDKQRYCMTQRLADFCEDQNQRFNRQRWLDYIAGTCGPNGGTTR